MRVLLAVSANFPDNPRIGKNDIFAPKISKIKQYTEVILSEINID